MTVGGEEIGNADPPSGAKEHSTVAGETNQSSLTFGLILLLFVASGFSSLIYQVVWTRMMVFVFGSTTFATATVLSVFMGGLALGSFLTGRRADKIMRPFLWYGVLEGIIGVWALLAPFLFDSAVPIYRVVWQSFHLDPMPFALLRFVAALIILLIPTTCMGATLPLLAKFVTDSLAYVGKKVGTLYAANTLGAVGGAAITGLCLLPLYGLNKTIYIGAAINFLLIATVFISEKFVERKDTALGNDNRNTRDSERGAPGNVAGATDDSSTGASPVAVEKLPDESISVGNESISVRNEVEAQGEGAAGLGNQVDRSVFIAAAGAVSTDAQESESEANALHADEALVSAGGVAHANVPAEDSGNLSPVVRATIFCFALSGAVAMVYEVGWTRTLLMVIGSSTYAFTLMLTSFLLGIFLGSLFCARLIDRAREPVLWFAIIQILLGVAGYTSMALFNWVPCWNLQLNAALPADPNTALTARFLIAASMMMPLTFFLGAVFPAAVKTCVKDLTAVGKSVSSLYSANTLGAIIGAFIAGFALIPFMGVEKSLIAGTIINVASGALMLFFVPSFHVVYKVLVLLAVTSLSSLLVMHPDIWYKDVLVYAQSARRRLKDTPPFKDPQEWHKWLYSKLRLVFYEEGPSSTVAVLEFTDGNSHSLITNGHVDASEGGDMPQQVLLAYAPLAVHPSPKDVAIVGWGSGVTIGCAARVVENKVTAIELEPAVIKASPFFKAVNNSPDRDPKVHIELNDGRNYLLATDQLFDVIISEPSNPWQAGVCNLFTKEYFRICKNRLRKGGVFALWCQIVEVPDQNIRSILASLKAVFPNCAVMRVDHGNIVAFASEDAIKIDLNRLRKWMSNKEIFTDFKRAKTETPETFVARMSISPDAIESFIDKAPPNDDDTNRLEFDVGRTYENVMYTKNQDLFNMVMGDLESVVTGSNDPVVRAQELCAIASAANDLSNLKAARYWIEASLKLNPTIEGYKVAGLIEYQNGDKDKAFEKWDQALKLDPRNVDLLQMIALIHLDLGERAKSREEFNRILSMEPGNMLIKAQIAHTYAPLPVMELLVSSPSPQENPQMVLTILQPLLSNQGFVEGHPEFLWDAAWAHYRLNQMSEAEQLARRFIELDPKFPAGKQLLGSILFARGNYTESSACWQQMMANCSGGLTALLSQVEIDMNAKRYKEALATLQATLVVAPFQRTAMTRLEELAKVDASAAKFLSDIEKFRADLE